MCRRSSTTQFELEVQALDEQLRRPHALRRGRWKLQPLAEACGEVACEPGAQRWREAGPAEEHAERVLLGSSEKLDAVDGRPRVGRAQDDRWWRGRRREAEVGALAHDDRACGEVAEAARP